MASLTVRRRAFVRTEHVLDQHPAMLFEVQQLTISQAGVTAVGGHAAAGPVVLTVHWLTGSRRQGPGPAYMLASVPVSTDDWRLHVGYPLPIWRAGGERWAQADASHVLSGSTPQQLLSTQPPCRGCEE